MGKYRGVKQRLNSKMWALVEWTDETLNCFKIIGDFEFSTQQEAEEYAKGFTNDSYIYKEPTEVKRERLLNEASILFDRLKSINRELEVSE